LTDPLVRRERINQWWLRIKVLDDKARTVHLAREVRSGPGGEDQLLRAHARLGAEVADRMLPFLRELFREVEATLGYAVSGEVQVGDNPREG